MMRHIRQRQTIPVIAGGVGVLALLVAAGAATPLHATLFTVTCAIALVDVARLSRPEFPMPVVVDLAVGTWGLVLLQQSASTAVIAGWVLVATGVLGLVSVGVSAR